MHAQLQTHGHTTSCLVNRCADHGIPCDRKHVTGLDIYFRLRWVRPLEVLFKYTGSIPRMCVSEYWQCRDNERESELKALQQHRVGPLTYGGKDLDWDDVILSQQKERRDKYFYCFQEHVRLGKCKASDVFIRDLDFFALFIVFRFKKLNHFLVQVFNRYFVSFVPLKTCYHCFVQYFPFFGFKILYRFVI